MGQPKLYKTQEERMLAAWTYQKVSRFILSLQSFGLRLCNFSHQDQIWLKLKAKHDRVKNAIDSNESSS